MAMNGRTTTIESINRTKLFVLVGLVATLAGCGSPPEPPKQNTIVNPAGKELTGKLQGMTPEERSKYLKEHPEELQKAMGSGFGK